MATETAPGREGSERRKAGVLVCSLGGSLIVPNEKGPNIEWLAEFVRLIVDVQQRWRKIVIVCGGGRTARTYIEGARDVLRKLDSVPDVADQGWENDRHWLGIHATRANAHLLRTIFRHMGNHAYFRVLKSPERVLLHANTSRKRIIIGAGWKPGWSTDYVAARMAHVFGAQTIVNLTNVDRVYDRDPKLEGARGFQEVSWEEFFRHFPRGKFAPGDNVPFDGVAADYAAKHGMRVVVLKGSRMVDLRRFFEGGPYQGTFRGTIVGGVARKGNGA